MSGPSTTGASSWGYLPLLGDDDGGAGQAELTAALVLDELSSSCAGIACVFAHHLAACLPLMDAGGKMAGVLSRVRGGGGRPALLTIAFPGLEPELERPRLEVSNGGMTLEGTARLVGCAAIADCVVLFPRMEGGDESCVVIETAANGVMVGETEVMLGLNAVPFADVEFSRVEISDERLAGVGGAAARARERALAVFRGFTAAVAMGAARAAHSKAEQYARERYQFGKMLIEHQEMRRMLGNMAVKTNIGTAGYIQGFAGEPLGSLATGGRPELAKVFCTDAALEVAMDAIQVHGGLGYMKEAGLEKTMRDMKMLQVLERSNRFVEVEHPEA